MIVCPTAPWCNCREDLCGPVHSVFSRNKFFPEFAGKSCTLILSSHFAYFCLMHLHIANNIDTPNYRTKLRKTPVGGSKGNRHILAPFWAQHSCLGWRNRSPELQTALPARFLRDLRHTALLSHRCVVSAWPPGNSNDCMMFCRSQDLSLWWCLCLYPFFLDPSLRHYEDVTEQCGHFLVVQDEEKVQNSHRITIHKFR